MKYKIFIISFIAIITHSLIPKIETNFFVGFHKGMIPNKDYKEEFSRLDAEWEKFKSLFDEHIIINPNYSEIPRIPKIIHQIWLGNNGKLPEKYKAFQISWINNHPDWEYILWTEKEIDEFGLKNRKHYDEADNYGVKSDIARYEILYRMGGLYIDTDFECLKPFDILHHLCDFYTGAAYTKNAVLFNGLIAATPLHPVLLECVENIERKKRGKEGYLQFTYRTGPHYFTKCFFKVISSHYGPSVIFPVSYFYPWPNYNIRENSPEIVKKWIMPESFAIHHWAMSWSKK
ncbi:glycosyltransferase family 32 protein [Candidatus Dependentiae bacterium]